jgi:hypothetical protein
MAITTPARTMITAKKLPEIPNISLGTVGVVFRTVPVLMIRILITVNCK